MKNKKTRLGLAGIVLAGVMSLGVGGCLSKDDYESPMIERIFSILPRVFQPGGYRDAQERKKDERFLDKKQEAIALKIHKERLIRDKNYNDESEIRRGTENYSDEK